MSKQSFNNLLRSPLYAGIQTCSLSDKVIPKDYGIITKEQHLQILDVMRGKKPAYYQARKVKNPDYPLKQFISCGSCGKYIRGSKSKGHSKYYSYYHCTICRKSYIGAKELNKQFVKLLSSITPSKASLRLFKEIVIEKWRDKQQDAKTRLRTIELEIDSLQRKKDMVVEKYVEDLLTKEEKEQQIIRLDALIQEYSIEKSELTGKETGYFKCR